MAAFAALDFIFLRAPQQTPRTHSFQGDPELTDLNVPLLTDPELAGQQRLVAFGPPDARPVGPPEYIAEYLAAEQKLGRVRADVAADRMAIVSRSAGPGTRAVARPSRLFG